MSSDAKSIDNMKLLVYIYSKLFPYIARGPDVDEGIGKTIRRGFYCQGVIKT